MDDIYKTYPHNPPHYFVSNSHYIVTGSTLYNKHLLTNVTHKSLVCDILFERAAHWGWDLEAWAILENHYHFIARAPENALTLEKLIRQFHSKSAVELNKLDKTLGRKVWHNYWDTCITHETSYYARLHYGLNNPSRYKDPSGHTPCGFAYSDPECPSKKETVRKPGDLWTDPPLKPDDKTLNKVRQLAGNDENLILAWLWLYNTPTGNEQALWIVSNNILMMWGDANQSKCEYGACMITINSSLRPLSGSDVFDQDLETQIQNELVATLAHETYHWVYGTPETGENNSQYEEYMAFFTENQIYFELTGGSLYGFDGYSVMNTAGLGGWFTDYASSYLYYPSYPPYFPLR